MAGAAGGVLRACMCCVLACAARLTRSSLHSAYFQDMKVEASFISMIEGASERFRAVGANVGNYIVRFQESIRDTVSAPRPHACLSS